MTLESDTKFEEKLTFGLENNMSSLANFHQNTWKLGLKIWTFMVYFYPKLKIYELKILQGSYVSWQWCKNWSGIDLLVQNWHEESDKFWSKLSKVSKICTLIGCLWPKYIMFELKTYREVTFDGTEYWCKIWRKTDLYFQKWQEFGKFWPEHLKVSKFGLRWDSFIQS